MRPLAEDVDTLRRVTTPAGRTLVDGGGIFPDMALQDDTLSTAEQQFLRATIEAEFPLAQRVVEFGFEIAAQRRERGGSPTLTAEEFQRFKDQIVAEGLDASLIEDQEIQDYLDWRVRVAAAQRMDDLGAEATVRRERDPVLDEAIRLLTATTSQAELFQEAERVTAAETATGIDP